MTGADRFPGWFDALEKRHFASLTFQEVRKGLQALSSLYVERRERLARGAALDGAGKRAAFGLFYGPLHFLTVRAVARALEIGRLDPPLIVDLGCGSAAAGAGWALASAPAPEVAGVELNGWAVEEARFNLRALGLRGRVSKGDLLGARLPRTGGVLLAWTLNELEPEPAAALLERLLAARAEGAALLVVEPIARRVASAWPQWAAAFESRGGRQDEWRFPAELPERLRLLDKAAGLDHRELTARSLFLRGSRGGGPPGAHVPRV
ncbi:MAG: hypothetical protein AB7O37_21990 [Vicinamibacteria bacterium]